MASRMEHHQATITVTPGEESGTSTVVWAYDVTPDEMLPIFTDSYTSALATVKEKFAG